MKTAPTFIDLTHTLAPAMPSWEGNRCFELKTTVDYEDCTPPNLFRSQNFQTKAGTGTHLDAPAHCIPGGKTIDELALDQLVTDGIVIKVDTMADENYLIKPEVVEQFEQKFGKIPANSFVIFSTGWSRFWNDPEKYRNHLAFPSIHESTAQLLLQRNIAGLGIDTLSVDAGDKNFPVHRIILGAGKYLVENIANAAELPATGAEIFILPLKMKAATEAPVRMFAWK